jgi:hypothetical protein
MDDPIDRLNRGMLAAVLESAADRGMLEWGIRMHLVSCQIERVGDNAVDIGEQVAFLVTGELHEFTDASHPEVEHPELLERGGPPTSDYPKVLPDVGGHGSGRWARRRLRPSVCAKTSCRVGAMLPKPAAALRRQWQ